MSTTAKERSILFNRTMVRAILDGSKVQTRKVIDLETLRRSETPGYDWVWRGQAPVRSIAQQKRNPQGCWQEMRHADFLWLCPYGQPGDRLWVQETYSLSTNTHPIYGSVASLTPDQCRVWYLADNNRPTWAEANWRPSTQMPRWASRLTLEITGVRVERIQNISEDDAIAEGVQDWEVQPDPETDEPIQVRLRPSEEFANLWDSTHSSRYGWNVNPWVWVIEFSRVTERENS